MIKLFKDTFGISYYNIILATPLVLFMVIVSMYLGFSKNTVDTLPEMFLSIFTLWVMFGAFLAAWFFMVKKAVKNSKSVFIMDEDQAKASFNLMKEIPTGIGSYFLSFLGFLIIFLVILILWGGIVYNIGQSVIGGLNLDAAQMKEPIASIQELGVFIDSLSQEQLLKLSKWSFLIFISNALFSFLLMLWAPEILFADKNPLTALFKSMKKIFVKFLKSLKLFIYISCLNFVLSFLNTFAILNPITYFLMMIVYFYFIVYLVVLVFLYYEREFCEENKE